MDNRQQKFTINDNTVSSANQLTADKYTSFFGNPNAKKRILIVGNSITRHGVKPDIGWHGDWGMAASAEEKDYVHLLTARILEKEDALVMVHQLALWEHRITEMGCSYDAQAALPLADAARAFAPDLLIFRLGENIKSPTDADGQKRMEKAFEDLIGYICKKETKIIFTTCFWKHGVVDDAIRAVAKRMDMPLTELGDLGDDEKYMAIGLFEHNGVAHHPGDLGMQAISDRIFEELEK